MASFAQAGGQRAKGVKQRLTKHIGSDTPGLQQEVGGATGNRTGSPLPLPDRGQLARKIEEGGGAARPWVPNPSPKGEVPPHLPAKS